MSLEKKLKKKREEGILLGYQDTWTFFEEAMKEVHGIGPKRSQAVLDKVMQKARERYNKVMSKPHSINGGASHETKADQPQGADSLAKAVHPRRLDRNSKGSVRK